MRARQPDAVSYADWRALDALELANGKSCGRPRLKYTTVEGNAGRARQSGHAREVSALLHCGTRAEHRGAAALPHWVTAPAGLGLIWKCSTLLVVPLPVSMWNGARVLTVAQRPRPFQPAFGSSMRPSIHLV